MQLHYYHDAHGNFGDDLNGWLFDALLPGRWHKDDGQHVSGIGTIIDNSLLKPQLGERWAVFSSGVGYAPPPPGFGGPQWEIMAVRGPLTAKVLDLPATVAVADGALLLATLPEGQPVPERARSGIVFMPHKGALPVGQWQQACALAGIEFIDPRADSKTTLHRLRHARLVLADAMHAAIVADTVRVPWVPLASSPEINSFKWLDWTLSLDLPLNVTRLPYSSVQEEARGRTLGLTGHDFLLANPTPEAAMAHYRRFRRMNEAGSWRYRKRLRAVYAKGLQPLLTSQPLHQWRVQADARRVEAAAAALQRAALHAGYLSDDGIFLQRVAKLQARLGHLAAWAGQP